jgi:lysyl-tRNA synthetase class II
MVEFYQAYADYDHDLMNLTEEMFETIVQDVWEHYNKISGPD